MSAPKFKQGEKVRIVRVPWGSNPTLSKFVGLVFVVNRMRYGPTPTVPDGEPVYMIDHGSFSVQESALRSVSGFGEWAKRFK